MCPEKREAMNGTTFLMRSWFKKENLYQHEEHAEPHNDRLGFPVAEA